MNKSPLVAQLLAEIWAIVDQIQESVGCFYVDIILIFVDKYFPKLVQYLTYLAQN